MFTLIYLMYLCVSLYLYQHLLYIVRALLFNKSLWPVCYCGYFYFCLSLCLLDLLEVSSHMGVFPDHCGTLPALGAELVFL